ncbi:MAG: hypothetical protein R2780_08095 [Crocinitomicaceae bacterium]
MNSLELKYQSTMIQGEFNLKSLNFLLVFQVNCPGCFFYALPLFNKLFSDVNLKEYSFLGLSTAFEDFDYNTTKNTELLCSEGILVGETKKALESHGYHSIPYQLDFPVAMDYEMNSSDSSVALIERICRLNPNFKIWPDWEQEAMRQKVESYLDQLERISYTFTANQLKGTPSLIVFDENYQVQAKWFGHVTYEEVITSLSKLDLIK